jgi:hypothetical protein
VLSGSPGRVGELSHVCLQVAPLHGVAQGTMQDDMDVVHGVGGEATGTAYATATKQPGVVGVDLGGVEALQLDCAKLRHEVRLDQDAIAAERRLPQAAFDRRQPDTEQELPQAESAGQDVGVLGQGGELGSEGCLAVPAAGEAGLGLPAALLGLAQFAAAGRAGHSELALDPGAPSAALTALGAIATNVEDVLPRSSRWAFADVTLRGDLLCVAAASLWRASPATPVGAPKARGRGPQTTAKVRAAELTSSSPAACEHLGKRWQSVGELHFRSP